MLLLYWTLGLGLQRACFVIVSVNYKPPQIAKLHHLCVCKLLAEHSKRHQVVLLVKRAPYASDAIGAKDAGASK